MSVPDMALVEGPEIFATLCAQCHGAAGEGKLEMKSPSIAGLPVWYVEDQTGRFKSGLRGYHAEDIFGLQMRAIVSSLSTEQISDAAKTVSELASVKTTVPEGAKESIDRGRILYANRCMECHRYNGTGDVVFHSATLISLNREYIEEGLIKYRDGFRGSVPGDIYGAKMVSVTQGLTDVQIKDLANYIGALANGDDPRPALER